jgi:signal transduction histidine kinase
MLSPSLLELPSKASKAMEPVTDKRTLLIVDDEEGPRQSLRIVFKDDYRILVANDGAAALELARNHPVDVAVLDIRMCGMSGIDLLGRLKTMDPNLQVIMLTAYETVETARQALRFGACDYLNKPFDVGTMRSSVRTAMEKRLANIEIRSSTQKLSELKSEVVSLQTQQELLRSKGEIYASVLHDINNPMTVISALIDLITHQIASASHLEGEDLAGVRSRLSHISRQVNNCITISRRYLGFMRDQSQENCTAPVNQILSDLGHLLRMHPSAEASQIVIQPAEPDILAAINGTELIQILLNLSVNALQCTDESHVVEISASLLKEFIPPSQETLPENERFLNREAVHSKTPLLMLVVKDGGPGIPIHLIDKVFDPFFTTKGAAKGTGLGLSIVRRLVQAANGAIHLKTQKGQGTAFSIYIPAAIV